MRTSAISARSGHPRRAGWCGRCGPGSSTARSASRSSSADDVADARRSPAMRPSRPSTMAAAVLGADVEPDARGARRRCGSCPGSRRRPGGAGRRAPRPARRPAVISVAAARCGTWLTTATSAVVALGREGHDLGAEARTRPTPRRRTSSSVVSARRGEHPDRALEQVGVGAVEALLLGAGHRVAAAGSEGRSIDADDRRLDAADVGDQPARRRPAPCLHGVGDGRRGRGDEGERRRPGRARPSSMRPPTGGRRHPVDVDVGRRARCQPRAPQGQADRAADEAEADDVGPRGRRRRLAGGVGRSRLGARTGWR